ncbi:histidine phosphatase family protein [Vagococcus salmoninarum]|uniref:histidine phosphatase family protein n=1 Tax=Vagococcus salmoninarum TaxID=2739 RepID=UPI003F9D9D4E
MELYFTRHGQTEWNQALRFQGREGDSPLLPKSHLEIKALGQRLAEIPFVHIYSSPQKRAKDTALGIQKELKTAVPITYLEELREIGMGELEGAYILEAKKTHLENLEALRYHPDLYDHRAFGGEDYQEMLDRSTGAVLKSVAEQGEGPILFVSHGATLTGCIQTLAGQPLAKVRQMGGLGNNTLSILKAKPGTTQSQEFELTLWDDSSHLLN